MTQALTGPESGLTRAERAALTIGRWVEQEEPGGRPGTRKELQERVGVSKGAINEAGRLLESRGRSVHRSTAAARTAGASVAHLGRRRRGCWVRDADS